MNAAEYLVGESAAARHGRRTALVCGNAQLTFAELGSNTRAAAGAWGSRGVRPGERVMILLRDTPEFAAAWLGALHAGAVAIAVNTKLSSDDQRFILEDSAARVVLTESACPPPLAEAAAASGAQCIELRAWRQAMEGVRQAPKPVELDESAPGFWLYSSGTTGHPKGIVHAHKDVLPCGDAMREVLGLRAGDTVFATSKLFFAYGLEHGLLGPLSIGATSILCPDAIDAAEAATLVARHQPTAFFSVPSFYRQLMTLRPEAVTAFKAVRYFIAAGERLPVQILDRWHSATGGEILSLYGMSETFCVAMMTPPGTSNGVRTGVPIAGVDTRLADETGAEPPIGQPGVLWIRHPALATGYAHRPDATREQFVDGWFCTKDVFVRDAEGFYLHQGRADEFIKVAGQWVQPGELEEAVMAGGAITEAACVRVNDADGFERLALFVTASAEPQATMAAAAQACEKRLPRHKRPKWIRVVPELPRTATGKIQRFKLRAILERELAG